MDAASAILIILVAVIAIVMIGTTFAYILNVIADPKIQYNTEFKDLTGSQKFMKVVAIITLVLTAGVSSSFREN